jgi:hypothetical protein
MERRGVSCYIQLDIDWRGRVLSDGPVVAVNNRAVRLTRCTRTSTPDDPPGHVSQHNGFSGRAGRRRTADISHGQVFQ